VKSDKTLFNNRWLWLVVGVAVGMLLGMLLRPAASTTNTGEDLSSAASSTQEQNAGDSAAESASEDAAGSDTAESDGADEEYSIAAPLFSLPDDNGAMINLADFQGSPVLINFWATWCPPCKQEMTTFENHFQLYQDQGLVILAVNTDDSEDSIRAFREEFGLSFHLLRDTQHKVMQQYAVNALPTSYFINAEGNVVSRHVGLLTGDMLDEYLSGVGIEP